MPEVVVRIAIAERRSDVRLHSVAPRERLWVMCNSGAMGGQAVLRDVSANGIRIAVNRAASRLIAALAEAQRGGTLVRIHRTLHGGYQTARVAWGIETGSSEVHFGLELESRPLTVPSVPGAASEI